MGRKAFSMFTGIRGLDIAVEALGCEVVAHAEVDPDASRELERQRPDVPNYGDVTTIDYAQVEPVEVLIGGGWPCQPFSQAGTGLGTADPRYLWPEVARAIRSLRPLHFYMEQVPDILDERKFPGVFSRCLSDLAEAGLDATWGCLRNADVGAPHGRSRLYLVAHAARDEGRIGNGNGLQAVPNGQGNGQQGHGQDDDRERTPATRGRSDAAGRGAGSGSATDAPGEGWQGTPPTPRRVEPEQLAGGFDWRRYEPTIRRWEAVVGPAPRPDVMVTFRGNTSLKLNPVFSAWMMALEPPQLSRRSALRCIGNAVNPLAAYEAFRQLDAYLRNDDSLGKENA